MLRPLMALEPLPSRLTTVPASGVVLDVASTAVGADFAASTAATAAAASSRPAPQVLVVQ